MVWWPEPWSQCRNLKTASASSVLNRDCWRGRRWGAGMSTRWSVTASGPEIQAALAVLAAGCWLAECWDLRLWLPQSWISQRGFGSTEIRWLMG